MTEDSISPGTQLGDFTVESLIGEGGMGAVYRATQVRMGLPVALKVLRPELAADPGVVARFVREAMTMRDLAHPSIVTVHDVGEDGGLFYLAMQLMEAEPLSARLRSGPLPVPEALGLLGPIADALDHAHLRNVVHRDVKPANVLFDAAGRPYLADFGIAKALDATSSTGTGAYLGTPRYMAPEQSAGTVCHRSDQYSFACLAFELLTGSPPYRVDDVVALLGAHACADIPSAHEREPALPIDVDAVFRRGMAKDPAQRYSSTGGFARALATAVGAGETVFAPIRETATSPDRGRPSRIRPAVVALVGVLAVAGVAGAALVTNRTASAPATVAGAGTAKPTAGPPASPPVAHGALFYEAAMDGTGRGFIESPGRELDPSEVTVEYDVGAMRIEALAPDSFAYVQLDVDRGIETYVTELDVSSTAGSEVELCWGLRWAIPRRLSYLWCLETASESAAFQIFRDGEFIPLGPSVPMPGLRDGTPQRVHLVVRERQLTMYLDGQVAVDVADDQVPLTRTLPGLDFYGSPGTGVVEVSALRVWELQGR